VVVLCNAIWQWKRHLMDHVENITTAYAALVVGDVGPLVRLMDSDIEWRGVPHRHYLRNHVPS